MQVFDVKQEVVREPTRNTPLILQESEKILQDRWDSVTAKLPILQEPCKKLLRQEVISRFLPDSRR